MRGKVDISHKTIFFIAGFLAFLWALYQIREVIILLFVAIIFMSALSPLVSYLEKYRIPRGISIVLTYIVVITIISALISLVVSPFVEQTTNLATSLPHTIDTLLPNAPIDKSVLQQEIGNFSKNAFSFTIEIFNNFIGLVSILVLTFYLLIERDKLDGLITQFFIGREDRIKRITRKIEEKLGAWLRGQIFLSFIIGALVYLMLLVLSIPYALPLAILAGLLEVVPIIGPIISAIPGVLIAYTISPILSLIVGCAYLVIQQLEGHVIVPQIMKKAVGLNPLVVILAVAIGGRLLGVAGALLAVPITVVVQIITQDVLKEEQRS